MFMAHFPEFVPLNTHELLSEERKQYDIGRSCLY